MDHRVGVGIGCGRVDWPTPAMKATRRFLFGGGTAPSATTCFFGFDVGVGGADMLVQETLVEGSVPFPPGVGVAGDFVEQCCVPETPLSQFLSPATRGNNSQALAAGEGG